MKILSMLLAAHEKYDGLGYIDQYAVSVATYGASFIVGVVFDSAAGTTLVFAVLMTAPILLSRIAYRRGWLERFRPESGNGVTNPKSPAGQGETYTPPPGRNK